METGNQILKELREIAPFLGNREIIRLPYQVPHDYFSDFILLLMNRIQFENEDFSDSADEMASISPLLAGIQNKNPYQAPANYFENLKIQPATVPAKGKTVIMRVLRYASAACIVALIGVTLFTIFNSHKSSDLVTSLSNISESDIANYLDSNDVHLTDIITPSTQETASLDFTDNEIHELLSSVSDAELEEYMPALPIEKRNIN